LTGLHCLVRGVKVWQVEEKLGRAHRAEYETQLTPIFRYVRRVVSGEGDARSTAGRPTHLKLNHIGNQVPVPDIDREPRAFDEAPLTRKKPGRF